MAGTGELVDFLDARKVEQSDKPFTHTGWGNTLKIPGKVFIGDDEKDEFYRLWIEAVDVYERKICLVEKCTEYSPLHVDLDFSYNMGVTDNQHTQEQIIQFVQKYMGQAKRYLKIENPVEIYVSEKRRATKKNSNMSAGIHLIVPDVVVTKQVEMQIRLNMLSEMDQIFGDLPLVEKNWNKVYDEGISKRSNNWMVYRAQKIGDLPYLITSILTWNPASSSITVSTDIPKISVEFMNRLSVRVSEKKKTPYTSLGEEEFGTVYNHANDSDERHNTVVTGGRAATPMRGRPPTRGAPGSRNLSPTALRLRPLTEEEIDYYRKHVMNLAAHRYEDYNDWKDVGILLWNIHPESLNDVWHTFSQQSAKYRRKDTESKWNTFTCRIDGPRLSKKSLLYWSRLDNPEGYVEIEKSNVDAMIRQSISSSTEHDVAQVVYAKFHDLYCCAHFSKDAWFKFNGQIWTETDKGVDLLMKLSDDIWKIYNKKLANAIEERGSLDSCANGKCMECLRCEKNAEIGKWDKMCKLLKSTNFKTNVMKECRLLFYDTEFMKKINENAHLFAFKNCIFDSENMTFRDGKQEDYMMFSAPFDFDPEKHYSANEAWSEVELFLRQILPEEDVREYVLKYLASCLSGTNEAQKFHIWTGTGANGKSMLMNLMEEAMGDYACKAPIALFTQSRSKAGNASPDVVKLRGKRFVTMSEPDEDYSLNTGLIKEYSSGEKITARDLYAGSSSIQEFVLRCKFNLGCNDLPKINSTDNGTWRRIIQLRFNSEFRVNPKPGQYKLDETIQQKVRSLPWAQAFMSYLVHVYITNNGCKNLIPPERIVAYTSEYREDSDAIARFMRECIRPVVDGEVVVPVRKESLNEVFRTWRTQTEELRVKMQDMMKRIESTYGRYPKGSRNTEGGWRTFQLVEQD